MKAAIGFIVLAAAAGALIGVTRALTHKTIAANEAAAEAAVVKELLGSTIDPDAAARLCHTEVRGYAGTIKLLILPRESAEPNRILEAVRVVSHRETPGIGDFIELHKTPWILSFRGLANQPQIPATISHWEQRLDAVTGATITRRAIIEGVARACPIARAKGSDPLFGRSSGETQ